MDEIKEKLKGYTGIAVKRDEKGNIVKKFQVVKGEIIATFPGDWETLGRGQYERSLDITKTDIIFQHGVWDSKAEKIIPTFTYSCKRSQLMEVKPYTKELRDQVKKEEGRSTFQFAEGKAVCVLPSASLYAKPGIMKYLDKTRV